MKEESPEMHSEDGQSLLEKHKKRTVKTRAQVEALEKFYTEHKYPTEAMKMQVAESIGLTEKQVSGWFCHRRLKDKKLMNEHSHAAGKQDRSSGVVQDRGSGHEQDSCGSTKQLEDRNFDNREVESGLITPKDLKYEHRSHYTENCNHMNDPSSGSSSSLRNMPSHHHGDLLDTTISAYAVTKFAPNVTKGVKRSGPSGYLKVKGRLENPAITAVKRKLGEDYREDGPPLGVQFDPLPPGAFEPSMHKEETYYTGEPASDDVAKPYQNGSAYEYKSSVASYNPEIDVTNYKMRHQCDIPDSYVSQRFRPRTSLPDCDPYYRRNSLEQLPEVPDRDEYRIKPRAVEVARIDSVQNLPRPQPYNGIAKEEREDSYCRKYNDATARVPIREQRKAKEFCDLTMQKAKEFRNSRDTGQSGRIIKGRKMHWDRQIIDDEVNIPFTKLPAPKRIKEEFRQQQQRKTSSAFDNLPPAHGSIRVLETTKMMPSSFSEDEESAETSSSVD